MPGAYDPTPEQSKAIEAYVKGTLSPLIEAVLTKQIGMGAVFMAESLHAEAAAAKERADFLLAQCRDAQAMASRYGYALNEIACMDLKGERADDLGRAARIARGVLLGNDARGVNGKGGSDAH